MGILNEYLTAQCLLDSFYLLSIVSKYIYSVSYLMTLIINNVFRDVHSVEKEVYSVHTVEMSVVA
jgi:hypothetical protein